MIKISKYKTIVSFLSILALSSIIIFNFTRLNSEINSVDVKFESGVIAKDTTFKQVISPILIKGNKKLKFNLLQIRFERTIQGKITIGDSTYDILRCCLIKKNNVFHYIGSLVNNSGELEISFVLDEKLTLLSIINFKSDTRINAPASTMKDFILIDSQVTRLF